ncbi:MAG TPA: hypothetical protein ENH13_00850 [Euryarchaeota archaeon]|nr:hypothetical protein [Euryarchaeota archaeon]
MIRKWLIRLVFIVLLGYLVAGFVVGLPPFGSADAPAYTHVVPRYIERSVAETGATNIISGIILDYRAYDTMGEATVLFTAALAILSLLGGEKDD